MAASNPELIPLIYRHLKEHGFHTAAEALQKQSLQVHKTLSQELKQMQSTALERSETPPPTSLLDIYSSWLKTSKRKKKSSSSTPGKKPAKPVKAAAKREKKDKTAKQLGSPNKKSLTKVKKVDGKASEKKIKSNNLKAKKKKKSGGGEDSDSDSSLDVEKWKKLVEQMTDADLAKVEEFNALAAPKPKRVRKSRAKPKPISDTATDAPDQQSKTPEKSTEDVVAQSNPTVAPVAALDSSTQEQNVEIPVANVMPAKKQSAEKKKRKSKDENPPKPKGKKVTKVANGDGEGLSHLIDKPVENNAEISNLATNKPMQESDEKISSTNQTEPKKKKKKRTLGDGGSILLVDQNFEKDAENTVDKCNNDLITEDLSSLSSSAVVESTVKAKKKKKLKSKEDCVQTVTAVTTEETLEKVTEESDPLTEVPISAQDLEKEKSPDQNPTKKKKKATTTPNMTTANGDGLVYKNVESSAETEKPMQESLENTCDLQTERKKKKKKHKSKEDSVELINSVTTEETLEKVAEGSNPITEEMPPKKKKKKHKSQVELDTLPPEDVVAETPQRTEKKKKKKQVSDEVPEEPSDPPSTPQTPGPKKKKHKLQPEELTEADPSSLIAENETPKKKKKKSSKGQGTES